MRMVTAPLRRSLPVLVTLVALAVLGACSSGSGGGDAVAAVRGAVEATTDAGAARVAMNIRADTAEGSFAFDGEGVMDLGDGRGRLSMDLSDAGLGAVETIIDGTAIYLMLPQALVPGGTPWVSLDVQQLGELAGADLGAIGQIQQANPSQFLDLLLGAGEVEEVGEEEVRGADTTHYRAVLDLQEAAAAVPEESRESFEAMIDAFETTEVPADVWIDDEGRLRKLAASLDPDGPGPDPGASLTFEMYDFGTTLDLQVPPPDEVTDITGLLGAFAGD